MQRAGLATAQLALALAPHASHIWIACGPGNNGGDGFEAALHLHRWGKRVTVTWTGISAERGAAAGDAEIARQRAVAAGVVFAADPPPAFDLCVDALLGIGASGRGQHLGNTQILRWLGVMQASPCPQLCVDVPSGLQADSGAVMLGSATELIARKPYPACGKHVFTLTFLGLKPGLFTARGRDSAGEVWLSDLGASASLPTPYGWLLGEDDALLRPCQPRAHAGHKGSYGDVAIVGGQSAGVSHMTGAALLAASGALHAGAGRVFVALLNGAGSAAKLSVDTTHPEFMFRAFEALDMDKQVIVCGVGGGTAVRNVIGQVLTSARQAVLDADALNAIATDCALQALLAKRAGRGQTTVLTPHPLEAARLANTSAEEVQQNRLGFAQQLADEFACVVVLKGSGTVVCAPGRLLMVNHSGNGLLASGGTGDVLAGMLGARLAAGMPSFEAACSAVHAHGHAADVWALKQPGKTLTASRLAQLQSATAGAPAPD